MLPTGVALLVVVMAVVVLAIILWTIAFPGLGRIIRQWRQGRWIIVLDSVCMLLVAGFLGILIGGDIIGSITLTMYSIGAILFGSSAFISAVTLCARWLAVRTRIDRTFVIFNIMAMAIYLVGGGLFLYQPAMMVVAFPAR